MDLFNVTVDAFRTCVGLTAAAYALSAIGLNLQFGFTGLLNLGHVGSMLLGAYGTAIAVDRGLPLGVGILIGLLAAVTMGPCAGCFCLKTKAGISGYSDHIICRDDAIHHQKFVGRTLYKWRFWDSEIC